MPLATKETISITPQAPTPTPPTPTSSSSSTTTITTITITITERQPQPRNLVSPWLNLLWRPCWILFVPGTPCNHKTDLTHWLDKNRARKPVWKLKPLCWMRAFANECAHLEQTTGGVLKLGQPQVTMGFNIEMVWWLLHQDLAVARRCGAGGNGHGSMLPMPMLLGLNGGSTRKENWLN